MTTQMINNVRRAALASAAGAALVGFQDTTVAQTLKDRTSRVVDSIAELKAIDKTKNTSVFVSGYYAKGDGGGGQYWYDSTDTTSADNGGTIIVASDGGRWKLAQSELLKIKQFGANGLTDDTAGIQSAATVVGNFGQIEGDESTYIVNGLATDSVTIDLKTGTLKAKAGATAVQVLDTSGYWRWSAVKNGAIDGNALASNGIQFAQAGGGRYVFESIDIAHCDKGFYKNYGNIGNRFREVGFSYCNYGYYVTSDPTMQGGSDILTGVHFGNCNLSAVYMDSSMTGTGQTIFDGAIIEYNHGFGVFIANYNGGTFPLEFRNVWMEGNHTAGSVTINGTPYTPKDWYIKNANTVRIVGCDINSLYAESSVITFQQCSNQIANYDFTAINCKIIFDDCFITSGIAITGSPAIAYDANISGLISQNIDIRTAKTMRNGNLFCTRQPMIPTNDTYVEGGTWVASYDGTRPYTATSMVPDFKGGQIFGTSLNKTASNTGRIECYAFNATAGVTYYIKCEIKLNSTDVPQCYVKGTGTVIATDFGGLLVKNEWVTVHLIGTASNTGPVDFWFNSNGGNIDVSFGACTVVSVNEINKIHAFFNSGRHIRQNRDDIFKASAIPGTINNSYVGARIENSAPTVGQPKAWVCTVAGSPGTWVSEGNL